MDVTNPRIGHGKPQLNMVNSQLTTFKWKHMISKNTTNGQHMICKKNKNMDNIKLQQGAQCDRNQI